MKNYIVYFAKNDEYQTNNVFQFEYSVEAEGEEEAKQKAIEIFTKNNSELNLAEYTYGFSKN